MKKLIWEDENVMICEEKGLQFLQFKELLKYPELEHCYTLRNGNKLNFMPEYVDKLTLENSKKSICEVLELDTTKLIKPHQTHTDKVEAVENLKQNFNEVDGIITNQQDITLCTTSADCTALLFYDPVKKVIGSVHSGWRGTVQRIGQKAVEKMRQQYGCEVKDIICCICPHIRKCHFEVEEDVVTLFYKAFSNMKDIENAILKTDVIDGRQKYYIDTTKINMEMLKEIGIKRENIIDSGLCTVCQKEYFHSYRVDKEKSGRNGAIISLRSQMII